MTDTNLASFHKPTLRERFWRKLGYRHVHADLPMEAETMPGWMVTDTALHLSFGDRIRLLISGTIKISTVSATDVQVSKVVNATRLTFPYPGEK